MANVILRVKREDGSWAEIPALVGPEGPQGVSINDIILKSQEGGVSTYLILLSDGSEKTFQVTDGAIITDVSLINTNVLIDTYRISISDGSYFDFRVTNGRGIKSIAKTSTDVLSDTYTIYYNDNTSSTYKVTNGRSITKIVKTQTDVLTDTYTISYNDNTTSTYTITNGRGIDYIEKDETIGLSDRYTIHYNDGTTSYYHVVNGEAGPAGSIGNRVYLSGVVDKVNDETGYERVKELKTSKFDKSKFTVVGSPLISDDGIADYTNTTSSNHIKLYKNLLIGSNNIKVEYSGICGEVTDGLSAGNTCLTLFYQAGGKVNPKFGHFIGVTSTLKNQSTIWYNSSGEISRHQSGNYVTNKGDIYKVIYTFDTEKVYFELYINGILTVQDYQLISDLGITAVDIYLGSPNFVNRKHNTTFDLKQFSVTVDGKEVFSGNPTALDTIKANNYTTTGSPIISSDGIFQANANGNYLIKAGFTTEIKKELRCDGRFYWDNTKDSTGNVIELANGSLIGFTIKTDGTVTLFNGTNTSSVQIEIPLKAGDLFDTEIIYNASTITLNVCLNEGVNYTTSIASQGLTTFNTWRLSANEYYWGGTIDLNTIHVYIDGNLVYQPCLKIPYTKAKTGSKIVDAAWKLRVEDCYNQYGAGNYYLFSSATEQFALPMPDIYGLIQTLEEKKVDRAGDTMTGALSINGPTSNQLRIYRQNPAYDTPETSQYGELCFYGSDKNFVGQVGNRNFTGSVTVDDVTTNYPINSTRLYSRTLSDDGSTNINGELAVYTDSRGNTWTYGPHPANKLDNSNKLATTNWVRNHCCTTPATTTSTASLDAPCYVIENYVNGTSWYRAWSDQFKEQMQTSSTDNRSINFIRPFTNTNYLCVGSEFQGDDNVRTLKFNTNTKTTTYIRVVGSLNPIGISVFSAGY